MFLDAQMPIMICLAAGLAVWFFMACSMLLGIFFVHLAQALDQLLYFLPHQIVL